MPVERDTHEIVTPIMGHKVVCYDWINGREKQRIDGAMFKSIETSGTGTDMKPKLSATMIAEQEDAAVEAVVISVDGNTENIVETVLDMRAKDYEFIVKHSQLVAEGGLDEKKETASETSTSKYLAEATEEFQTTASP